MFVDVQERAAINAMERKGGAKEAGSMSLFVVSVMGCWRRRVVAVAVAGVVESVC